jgi:hypothetical protein
MQIFEHFFCNLLSNSVIIKEPKAMRIAYEYGDAIPQKTRRPPLVLLRTPTAKECF